MNLQAVKDFTTLLNTTAEDHAWTIPTTVIDYTAHILADKLDKNPWQPEPSYAEQYLQLRSWEQARALGDTCFFTRALFPELKQRRGIGADYYVFIGQGSYNRVLAERDIEAVRLINQHFEFLAEVVWTAIRAQGSFRSMWD